MIDELVKSVTALRAKEKGFDIPTRNVFTVIYSNEDVYDRIGDFKNWNKNDKDYSRPTQSLLQRWLREKHKLHIDITAASDDEYGAIIGTTDNPEWIRDPKTDYVEVMYYSTYEAALEAALIDSLKLIK